MSVNKVILLGYVGSKPEIRYTPSGVPVCKFSLATSKKRKDQSGNVQEKTTWHKIVTWNKLAENCAKYLDKGKQIFLEGEIDVQQWEKDGQKHSAVEIVADRVEFLSAPAQQEVTNDRAPSADRGVTGRPYSDEQGGSNNIFANKAKLPVPNPVVKASGWVGEVPNLDEIPF